MALSKKVVTFLTNTTTGNQAITGVGFQPELVILLCNGTSAGVAAGNGFFSLGAATSSSARWVVAGNSQDGAATSNTSRVTSTGAVLALVNLGGASIDTEADLVSMDSDGFTLNFVSNVGTALKCVALCLAGTDLDVAVGSFSAGTTTGTNRTAVTGLGFQPKAVLVASTSNVTGAQTNNRVSFGFATGASNQWATGIWDADAAGTMDTGHTYSDASYLESVTAISHQFNSFTSSGWNHDVTTAGYSALVCYVAFGGSAQFYAGSDTQKTTTGTEARTGVGFQPSAMLTGMGLRTTNGYDAAGDAFIHLGFMDGTSEAGGHVFSDDNTANAETSRGVDETYSLFSVTDDATPTVPAKASLSSFDSDGFTVNWNTADATARLFGFLAIGPAGASFNPAWARGSNVIMGVA